DGAWLVVTAASSGGAVVDVMPLRPAAAPVRITPGTGEATEYVGVAGGRLLFRTDLAAPRGRVVAIDPLRPQPEHWADVVAMQDSLTLRGAYAAGGRLLLHYLDGPRPSLVVQDGATRTRVDVPVGLIWTDYLPGWAPFSARNDRDVAYFRSINLAAPGIYAIDMQRAVVEPFRLRETGVDATSFESRVVSYTSRDGTRVPMFLIGRRDRPAGPAPVLLQAYGAYGFTSIPFFNAKYVTFIERGGTFAIPFTRGDGVYGDAWHRAGRGAHKTNTVDDLIAAAEYLLAEGLAAPGTIGIEGQGPGGMVAGAAVLARPELWGAATLEAPVTDPIRTQLRSGRGSAEYGNIQDSAVVRAMQQYAPYYMVRDGASYPPILVRTGDQDRTIDPFHSYKLVERLQRAGSTARAHLRVSWTEAHGFLRSAERRALDWADDLLFIEASLRPVAAPAPVEVRTTVGGDMHVIADLYRAAVPSAAPAILLFHQGGGDARGEYVDIIPRLLAEGFHVLSSDVRGGGSRFGDGHRAPAAPPGFRYCSALAEVEAAVTLARTHGLTGPLILWGSSYTATLAIQAGARRRADVRAVLAFSPASGELLGECPPATHAHELARAEIPLLLVRSSAELEDQEARARHDRVAEAAARTVVADGSGHGSSILVASRFQGDVAPQWAAVLEFLRAARSPTPAPTP
ncbi:MAG TPA: prolyl oligopeptidase family serine peptidase, partial [Longimicrobiales bacterium]|nr:prolyl oligopeptidase family serine peptidase [Longimicrobiales bacterium]